MNRTALAMVASLLAAAPCLAQFETATITATVEASATLVDPFGNEEGGTSGGPFSGFYKGLNVSFGVQPMIGEAYGSASAQQSTTFTPTTITSYGFTGTDIDDPSDEIMGDSAIGTSSLTVVFTLTEPTPWSFSDLSTSGTHASSSVTLFRGNNPKDVVFVYSTFGPYYEGEVGMLQAGTYTFEAVSSSFTFAEDGYGGLFAGSSFSFTFALAAPPAPCAGDADLSGMVNFDDLTTVLANFGTDYSPGSGLGDADANSFVNFDDLTTVLANFGTACN